MTINHPPSIEDAIHRALNFVKEEEEKSLLEKKYSASKKPQVDQAITWTRNGGNNFKKGGRRSETLPAKKQNSSPDFAFSVNEEEKEEQGQGKKWTRDPDAYCDFHKSDGQATINCETMRKVLVEKYNKGELKDIDLGPPPKEKGKVK